MRSVKITVVGDPAVGKTALCVRYRDGSFVQTHQITYFDMHSFKIRFGTENEECSISLWDTAGKFISLIFFI
jgi:GTPase SAR1 family protein